VMADVSAGEGAGGAPIALGEPAVFIGSQSGPLGEGNISIEEVALQAGTIPYEISCAWGRRVRRVYFEE
jgi:alanine racemase